jgi:hypothetical protein
VINVTSMKTQKRFGKSVDALLSDPVATSRYGYTAAFNVPPCDMQDLQDARYKRTATVEACSQQTDLNVGPLAAKLKDNDVLGIVKVFR